MSRETPQDTSETNETSSDPKPKMPVRRFDVFAEYNRQKALQDGVAEDEAEGYGLWVAKVVASGGGRSTGLKRPSQGGEPAKDDANKKETEEKAKGPSKNKLYRYGSAR